jgi:hypothetical protein
VLDSKAIHLLAPPSISQGTRVGPEILCDIMPVPVVSSKHCAKQTVIVVDGDPMRLKRYIEVTHTAQSLGVISRKIPCARPPHPLLNTHRLLKPSST